MNTIRRLLFAIEEGESGMQFEGDEAAHVELLVDAGLVVAKIHHLRDSYAMAHVIRLTWNGHDFLDAMRDETIWRKAQDSILKPIGGVAFDVLLSWLKWKMSEKLGLPGSA